MQILQPLSTNFWLSPRMKCSSKKSRCFCVTCCKQRWHQGIISSSSVRPSVSPPGHLSICSAIILFWSTFLTLQKLQFNWCYWNESSYKILIVSKKSKKLEQDPYQSCGVNFLDLFPFVAFFQSHFSYHTYLFCNNSIWTDAIEIKLHIRIELMESKYYLSMLFKKLQFLLYRQS